MHLRVPKLFSVRIPDLEVVEGTTSRSSHAFGWGRELRPEPAVRFGLSRELQSTESDNTVASSLPIIWIVDDDLGFVWWLGMLFAEAGCQALPALNCEEARSLMRQYDAGLIVVNPLLAGVGGLLKTLRRANPKLQVVMIQNSSAPLMISNTLPRPSSAGDVSPAVWRKKIHAVLRLLRVR